MDIRRLIKGIIIKKRKRSWLEKVYFRSLHRCGTADNGLFCILSLGIYIDWNPEAPVTTFMTTDEDTIYMKRDGEYVPFEIRGVNLGVGIPGTLGDRLRN